MMLLTLASLDGHADKASSRALLRSFAGGVMTFGDCYFSPREWVRQ